MMLDLNQNVDEREIEESEKDTNLANLVKRFEDLNLDDKLLKGITSHGFIYPTSIQSRALAPCIDGRDVIAQAQSGTGKTGTFVISALQRIDIRDNDPIKTQVMAIAPTRELASQIFSVFKSIGQYMDIKCVNLIGGEMVDEDIKNLRDGAHVVVGCPGRVIHMIQKNKLSCNHIKMFVLDEADEMLTRGFVEQVHFIFQRLPKEVQVVLLSATMSEEVIAVTEKFMRDPVTIRVKKEKLTLDGIKQFFFMASSEEEKERAILDILGQANIPQMVLFCNTRRQTDHLTKLLTENRFVVSELHSDMQQADRKRVMENFRAQRSRILICTNVIARGIDVQSVSLVINYELPVKMETYIHRIGRAGRFGRTGVAINLIKPSDEATLKEIIANYQTKIEELPANFSIYFSSNENQSDNSEAESDQDDANEEN